MLAVDEPTIALATLADHGVGRPGDRALQEQPPPRGTAVYHCYRYESRRDPVPTYADGTRPQGLPDDARGWRLVPWRQYEHGTEFDAQVATRWLERELARAIAGRSDTGIIAEWTGAVAAECAAALNTLDMAFQIVVGLPEHDFIALSVVAIWDTSEIHPLLRKDGWQ